LNTYKNIFIIFNNNIILNDTEYYYIIKNYKYILQCFNNYDFISYLKKNNNKIFLNNNVFLKILGVKRFKLVYININKKKLFNIKSTLIKFLNN